MEQIVSSSSFTRDHQSSARVLARVMRAVLSGDRQEIVITPTNEDVRAAQALLQLAARVESDRTLQGKHTPRLIHITDLHRSPNQGAISREQERGPD